MAAGEAAKPPDKTRRAVILATVGIVVILGVAVFYVAVVAPLRETHAVLGSECRWRDHESEAVITRLGGPERALGRLLAYRRLPTWMKADRPRATYLLGWCGPRAVPALVEALNDPEWRVRAFAAGALGRIGPAAREAIPALEEALEDESIRFNSAFGAREALKKIRGEEQRTDEGEE